MPRNNSHFRRETDRQTETQLTVRHAWLRDLNVRASLVLRDCSDSERLLVVEVNIRQTIP